MKASELTIGAYLQHANGKYFRITRIDMWGDGSVHFACGHPHLWDYNNKFSPIPLTTEILEKNGFVKGKTQYDEDFYEFWSEDSDHCIYLYVYKEYFLLFDNSNMKIKYVHELQHALRLCNIEKTIEL